MDIDKTKREIYENAFIKRCDLVYEFSYTILNISVSWQKGKSGKKIGMTLSQGNSNIELP